MASQVTTSSQLHWTETWSTLKSETWAGQRLSDDSWAYLTEYRHTADQATDIAIAESATNGIGKISHEVLIVAESISKGFSTFRVEALRVVDGRASGLGKEFDEPLRLAELTNKAFDKPLTDGFAITDEDRASKDVSVEIARSLKVAEAVFKTAASNLAETLGVLDVIAKDFDSQWEDGFGISDAHKRLIGLNPQTDLAIAESTSMNVGQQLRELVRLAETLSNGYGMSQESSFGMVDSIVNSVSVNVLRNLKLADKFDRTVAFLRAYDESISVTDKPSKLVGKAESQRFAITSAFILPANMLIADMLIEGIANADYTSRSFFQSLETGAMPGWTPWRTFIPGDYDYSKAMFRVIMDSVSADRGYLESCMAAVDVPDVIDRGTGRVTVAANGIAVEFEREYHIIPEITLTARGGTGTHPTAAELVGNPTLLGFTAKLRDTVTGEYVTGSFTWASHGY